MFNIHPKSKPGYINYHLLAGLRQDGLCAFFSDCHVNARTLKT